jgi:hypothetical protein
MSIAYLKISGGICRSERYVVVEGESKETDQLRCCVCSSVQAQ